MLLVVGPAHVAPRDTSLILDWQLGDVRMRDSLSLMCGSMANIQLRTRCAS